MMNKPFTKFRFFGFILSLVLSLSLAPTGQADGPGDLDPAFGPAGWVTTNFNRGPNEGRAVVLQPDGKIVMAGRRFNGESFAFALARYHSDGRLDATFGTGGRVSSDFDGRRDGINAIALQADGKILAAGSSYNGDNTDLTVVRYHSDGSLDLTFGVNGLAVADLNVARAIALQPDGKIVVAGTGIARCDSNGQLDPTFGSGGLVMGGDYEALAIQADGKILVAGSTDTYIKGSLLTRFDSAGQPDPTFGTDGIVATNSDPYFARIYAIALQPDGKIVTAGYTYDAIALARYHSDGSLDLTFGTGGRVITDLGSDYEKARAIALQADGKIVVAGSDANAESPNSDAILARYDSAGQLDPTFGAGGLVTGGFGSQDSLADAVVLQPDGQIVVAGYSNTGFRTDMALARYDTAGHLDPTFGTTGLVLTHFETNSPDSANAIALQPDGKIILAGYSGTGRGRGRDAALARYDSSGQLDPTFGTAGLAVAELYEATAVALQADGRILIASEGVFNLARLDGSGNLDPTFGSGGFVSNDGLGLVYDLILQPDGKIVTVGKYHSTTGVGPYLSLVRCDSAGNLDPTFGENGWVLTREEFMDRQAGALQPDGKIVAMGLHWGTSEIILVRYDSTGKLDPTFGNGGLITGGFNRWDNDSPRALALQTDGKILVVGDSYDGSNSGFALVRYDSTGHLDPTFGSDGLVLTDFGGDDRARALALQPDGQIVVAGWSNNEFALARYNSDGSLDPTFGTGGRLITDFDSGPGQANAVAIQPDGQIVAAGASNQDFVLVRYRGNFLTRLPLILKN